MNIPNVKIGGEAEIKKYCIFAIDKRRIGWYTIPENKAEPIRSHLLAQAMLGQYVKGKRLLCVLSAGEFRSALCY